MKKILFLFLILSFISCHSNKDMDENTSKNKEIVIKGSIKNYKFSDSIFKISLFYEDIQEGGKYNEQKFPIDSIGGFEINFNLNKQQNIGLAYKSLISLILAPGDNTSLTFDGAVSKEKEVYKSLRINGTSSKLNKLFANYNGGYTFNYRKYSEKLQELKPDVFKHYHDSVFKAKAEYIDNFTQTNKVTNALKNWLAVEKHFVPLRHIASYKMYYQMYTGKPMDSIKVSNSFYESLNHIPVVKNADLINSVLASDFSRYYYYHYLNKARKLQKEEGHTVDHYVIEEIISSNKDNKLLAQLLVLQTINSKFDNNEITFYEDLQNQIDSLYLGSDYADNINNKYAEIKGRLENPQLPEKTEILTFNSDDPNKFLDEIITNANGKIVYIDNWATWCGPCKSEFKNHTPQFKEKYKENVEFVYLCYQSPEKLWKPTIAEFKIEGKHYFVNKEDNKILFDKFNLSGFPTYVILDQKGEIIKSGFEYRPSEKETSNVIDKLIGK